MTACVSNGHEHMETYTVWKAEQMFLDIIKKYLLGMKTLPGTHTKHKLIIFSTYCSEAQKWKEWSIVQS